MIKLVVGIGNPDEEYQNTRHNIGFMFLDYLAKKTEVGDFKFDKKSNSLVADTRAKGKSIILAKPQTYVNKSGEAVKNLVKTYGLRPTAYDNLIIVHDDLDIPFGNIKISFDRNSGGHKGVESIMRALKTKKFYRLRIGIATTSLQKARQQSDKKRDEFVIKMVLSKFTPSEKEQLKNLFKKTLERLAQQKLA